MTNSTILLHSSVREGRVQSSLGRRDRHTAAALNNCVNNMNYVGETHKTFISLFQRGVKKVWKQDRWCGHARKPLPQRNDWILLPTPPTPPDAFERDLNYFPWGTKSFYIDLTYSLRVPGCKKSVRFPTSFTHIAQKLSVWRNKLHT